MYINPFLAGVVCTLVVEILALFIGTIVLAIKTARIKKHGKQ